MTEPTILVGYQPDERGHDALCLAALVARLAKRPLTAAIVHAPAWPVPGPGAVDAEWQRYLRQESKVALAEAAELLTGFKVPKRSVKYVVHEYRGSGQGLIEVAEERGASLIVIGSGPRGRPGRIVVGTTADQLLHSSPVPVLLAPRGYAEDPPEELTKLTVAYWGQRRDAELGLQAAIRFAAQLRVPVRLLTLVVRQAGITARFGRASDLLEGQHEAAEQALESAAALVGDQVTVTTEVLEGADVDKALASAHLAPDEVLLCMSSRTGPLRKVFLGDMSGKIVRAARCPVLVLPRATLH
jgi:nucleotide-binding universal stress UspA family protein